jgi:hypothetical protein
MGYSDFNSIEYKQSATYKQFAILYDLKILDEKVVSKEARDTIHKATELINTLKPSDFREDHNGRFMNY